MKKYFFILSLFCLSLVSCDNNSNPNDPYGSNSNSQQRDYCNVTFVNATSNYAVKIFLDGKQLTSDYDLLWKGNRWEFELSNLSFSKHLRFELHEISDNESGKKYYTAVSATYSESIKFDYTRDYQFTIEDEGIRKQSVYAE